MTANPDHREAVAIYVLDEARAADDVIGTYGDTAMCASAGPDYASTSWPIVVKVKPTVTRAQLVQHLLDLAGAIDRTSLFDPQTLLAVAGERQTFYSLPRHDNAAQP